MAAAAPTVIRWLQAIGVQFSTNKEQNKNVLRLAREGGHSYRRIVHSRDQTGRALVETMLEQIKERPNIRLFEDTMAIDLVCADGDDGCCGACLGLHAFNTRTQKVKTWQAGATVLATGGAGKVLSLIHI